jgi:hypothetical protein
MCFVQLVSIHRPKIAIKRYALGYTKLWVHFYIIKQKQIDTNE